MPPSGLAEAAATLKVRPEDLPARLAALVEGQKRIERELSDARKALALATKELLKRIATLPAPSRLRRTPSRKKQSDLPSGISGPIVRQRAGSRVRDCSFAVTLPRFGETPLATLRRRRG